MKQDVLDILDSHRVMTIATLRPDGWPQATMVSYAHEDLRIYFMVSRASQKLANMARDNRVSIAIGADAEKLAQIKGLSMSAYVYPITDAAQREHGYSQLVARRPELATLPPPDWSAAAIVRAIPRDVFILDFSKGLGHADSIHVGGAGEAITLDPIRPDDWGPTPHGAHEPSR